MKKDGSTSITAKNETLSARYAELLLLRREIERLEAGRMPQQIRPGIVRRNVEGR